MAVRGLQVVEDGSSPGRLQRRGNQGAGSGACRRVTQAPVPPFSSNASSNAALAHPDVRAEARQDVAELRQSLDEPADRRPAHRGGVGCFIYACVCARACVCFDGAVSFSARRFGSVFGCFFCIHCGAFNSCVGKRSNRCRARSPPTPSPRLNQLKKHQNPTHLRRPRRRRRRRLGSAPRSCGSGSP